MTTDRAELRALLEHASPAPWTPLVQTAAGVVHDGSPDRCDFCEGYGEPVARFKFTDGTDGHTHAAPDFQRFTAANGEPVAGNYDYEEGGIILPADGRLVIAARNALPELLDAADERDRLRAEIDRRVAAGTKATVDAVSALSQRCGELAAELLDARRSGFDEHEKTRAALRVTEDQRDSARATAVALEQQNAVLLETADEVTRKRADAARATGPDPWAENAVLLDGLARLRKTACDGCDAAEVAHNVLASVDPLRDEPEAADRG